MNTIDFQANAEAMRMMVEAFKMNQHTTFAESMRDTLSPALCLSELHTLKLSVPRQFGKTQFIVDTVEPDDLVILSHASDVTEFRSRYFEKQTALAHARISRAGGHLEPVVIEFPTVLHPGNCVTHFRGRSGRSFSTVWVEEPQLYSYRPNGTNGPHVVDEMFAAAMLGNNTLDRLIVIGTDHVVF